jgi:hypothetical protein
LAGLSASVRALKEEWRGALLRFLLALAGASIAWLAVAPVYAAGLAAVVRKTAPALERTQGARYTVEGSRVLALRPVQLPGQARARELVHTLWAASANFGLPVFAALVLATPGWDWRQRGWALAWGLGVLTLTQIALVFVTNEFWQQAPVRSPEGKLVYLPGHSALRLQIFTGLYSFFEIMSRGFFALLAYFGALMWPAPAGPGRVGRATRADVRRRTRGRS